MLSESSVNSNNVKGNNNNDGNRDELRNNNNGEGGEAMTRAEFNQLQENIRLIMERLEVRDRRSQSGAGSKRRHSSDESDASSERSRRENRDDRCKGIENIKLKITPFTGSGKLEEFLDWVPRVEKVFDCYEWDECTKVKMASLAFSEYASLW